jgi:hypothetical protein
MEGMLRDGRGNMRREAESARQVRGLEEVKGLLRFEGGCAIKRGRNFDFHL